MLKRIHIQGYKSLKDAEVTLSPLVVLVGPNAAGKSNLLDALQLLSKLGTSRTLREAFDPPYRGKPSNPLPSGARESRACWSRTGFPSRSRRSEPVGGGSRCCQPTDPGDAPPRQGPARVRERDLRYRIEVEMLPRSGILRVATNTSPP